MTIEKLNAIVDLAALFALVVTLIWLVYRVDQLHKRVKKLEGKDDDN